MPTMCDLKNRKFGRLTALYPTEKRNRKGSVYWHCRCECGNEIDVSECGLVHGNYKSCGCLRKENQQNVHNRLHLTDGTCVEWLKSRKNRRDSTSGFRGVYKTKSGNFRVTIGFKGERFQLGTYRGLDEAIEARLKAEHLIHDGFIDAYEKWREKKESDPGWAVENPLIYNVYRENGELVIKMNI